MSKLKCPHFTTCSGCSYELENVWPSFLENIPFPLQLVSQNLTKWRMRSKLAIRGTSDKPLIGLFKKGSHEVQPIPHCLVHHPLINEATRSLEKMVQKAGIKPYNEKSGLLRYVQFDVVENAIMAAFAINSQIVDNQSQKFVDLVVEKGWKSTWINFNTRSDNVIFSDKWQHLSGDPYLWRSIAGTPIATTPASFSQANPALFSTLVASLRDELRSEAKIVEFYAGNGSVSLPLLEKLSQLVAIEQNPHAEELFLLSAKKSPKVSYITGDVKTGLPFIEEADTIIIDPPRKGLDPLLLASLKEARGKDLFYISCGWNSFLRDYNELTQSGWILQKARAYLLFPGSDHIELLVSFKKN